MRLEQGDSFERQNINWTRKTLPFYEDIWKAFIGHDGRGTPCSMPGLNAEQQVNRKRFYQAHYSFPAKLMQVQKSVQEFESDLEKATENILDEVTQRLFQIMCAVGYIKAVKNLITYLNTVCKSIYLRRLQKTPY